MLTKFINSGIVISSFILLNIISIEFSRSSPATFGLNISFISPKASLVLFFFNAVKPYQSWKVEILNSWNTQNSILQLVLAVGPNCYRNTTLIVALLWPVSNPADLQCAVSLLISWPAAVGLSHEGYLLSPLIAAGIAH